MTRPDEIVLPGPGAPRIASDLTMARRQVLVEEIVLSLAHEDRDHYPNYVYRAQAVEELKALREKGT